MGGVRGGELDESIGKYYKPPIIRLVNTGNVMCNMMNRINTAVLTYENRLESKSQDFSSQIFFLLFL